MLLLLRPLHKLWDCLWWGARLFSCCGKGLFSGVSQEPLFPRFSPDGAFTSEKMNCGGTGIGSGGEGRSCNPVPKREYPACVTPRNATPAVQQRCSKKKKQETNATKDIKAQGKGETRDVYAQGQHFPRTRARCQEPSSGVSPVGHFPLTSAHACHSGGSWRSFHLGWLRGSRRVCVCVLRTSVCHACMATSRSLPHTAW